MLDAMADDTVEAAPVLSIVEVDMDEYCFCCCGGGDDACSCCWCTNGCCFSSHISLILCHSDGSAASIDMSQSKTSFSFRNGYRLAMTLNVRIRLMIVAMVRCLFMLTIPC